MDSTESHATLKHDSVGVWRVAFQGISATAPAAVVATITAAAYYAGGAIPLSFLISFLAVLGAIVPIYQYTKKVASAGGYYSFVSHSSGPFLGTLTGLIILGYEVTDLAFVPIFLSVTVIFMFQYFGGIVLPAYVGLIVIVVGLLLYSIPPYMGIKPSLAYSITFGLAEIVVLVVIAMILAVQSGPQNTLEVFTPSLSPTGIHGALIGGIFGMTSFLGYASVATLGEEARAPKKTIGLGLLVNVLISGTFFLVVTYGFTVAWGPKDAASMGNYLVPLTVITNKMLGIGAAAIITFFFLESFFNSGLSFTTAAIRYFYGMARDETVIPKYFSVIEPKSGVPRRALGAILVPIIILSVAFAASYGLVEGFVLLATAATLFYLIASILVNMTVWRLYKKTGEFKWFSHLIIPVASSVLFAFIIYGTVYPPSYPLSYMPIVVVIWIVASIFITLYVKKTKPENYKKAGLYSTVE